MQSLTPEGQQLIQSLAQRYSVSTDAVLALLYALINGNGRMAQFNHWELGGAGQWMQGGMLMIGDMFNHALKAKVDGLCTELAGWLARQPAPVVAAQSQTQRSSASLTLGAAQPGQWWPAELGTPATSGAQNNLRYAYFPNARRLAIDNHGQITVYDTLDHQIGGVGQQQGAGASLTFTSQHGVVALTDLPVISGAAPKPSAPDSTLRQESDILTQIEKLAELRQKGILSEAEFSRKKTELLNRL